MRLVVPYFGQRPAYFPLTLRSMAANPDVSWMLLTDQPVAAAPANVAVQVMEFDVLVRRIRRLRPRHLAGRAVQALRLSARLRRDLRRRGRGIRLLGTQRPGPHLRPD